MKVYNLKQQSMTLGHIVGEGGEATVYQLVEHRGWLAKIYNRPPHPDYQQKLTWMQANPPQDPSRTSDHASIAWPLEILYNQHGHLIGYLMPRVYNAVSLLEVFNPRRRVQTLPGFNWQYLHRTARNLATALEALHTSGYVVGDLNESNIMVTPSALVTIIDTDSFQIQAIEAGRTIIYPCPVGKPEYTPPELQGRSFKETYRQPEHDRFGLGVLIFQLLMNGNHPFRAQWLGAGDPLAIEERIRLGCFPYLEPARCDVAPPRHSPALSNLHPQLVELIRLCFVDGHGDPEQRPAASAWSQLLERVETSLVRCQNSHYYAAHLANCPECAQQNARRSARQQAAATPNLGTAPQIRPIVASPMTRPISSQGQAAASTKSPALPRYYWLGVTAGLVAFILLAGGLFAVIDSRRSSNAALPPTVTALPTYTTVPTPAEEIVSAVLARPTPTDTPRPANTPHSLVTDTPVPLPPTPTSAPTQTPVPKPPSPTVQTGKPEIFIVLPDGESYKQGDTIKVIVAVQDPNGVGNVYWWVTNAETQDILLRDNYWCENSVDCLIKQEVTDLSLGTFNLFVSAFDTLQNSDIQDMQIVVQ